MYFDTWTLLMLLALGLGLFAQSRVKSAYAKYMKVPTQAGLPAARWPRACCSGRAMAM